MRVSIEAKRRAYAAWLRTGRWPVMRGTDGTEWKFNPYHDPKDGRFTTAGGGGGAGGSRQSVRVTSTLQPRQLSSKSKTDILAGPRLIAKAIDTAAKTELDFADGVSDGAYDAVKGTVTATIAFAKNPISATRNNNLALAGLIDSAIAAEDTPARIQIARAADRIRHTNAHEVGYVAGNIAAGAAISRATGLAIGKISAIRKARLPQRLRPEFPPPEYKWVKERLRPGAPQRYNDGAPNARPGYAPALTRTLPNGGKRLVKFDGIQADWPVDRKHGIYFSKKSVDQAIRQSHALAEHKITGLWEVPDDYQKSQALKLLNKANVKNIKVRVAKP